jgi:hypothetical protein
MIKRTVRMRVQDAAINWRGRCVRDEILTPITTGKTFALGETWTGSLRPKLDYFVAQVEPLTRGFALGHVVGAEDAPGGLNLGAIWTGFVDLRDTLLRAVENKRPDAGEWNVNLDDIFRELEAFRRSIGSRPDQNVMSAAVDGLKRARDSVDRQVSARHGQATGDAQNVLRRMNAAASAARSQIRDAATRFYGGASQALTRDSVTSLRDALHVANTATDTRTKMRSLNAANKAFWAPRTRDHLAVNLSPQPGSRGALQQHIGRGAGSGAPSIEEINAANRRFWANR